MNIQGLVQRTWVLLALSAVASHADAQTRLFVSTQGRDTWSGTLERPNPQRTNGPKRTIEGARNAIRAMKAAKSLSPDGAIVSVADGVYLLTDSVKFNTSDSGTPSAPIVYRSARPGRAILEAGRPISTWRRVPNNIAKFLKGDAKTKVMSASLRALRITKTSLGRRSAGFASSEVPPELMFDNVRMRVSQFPNTGWLNVPSDHNGSDQSFNIKDAAPASWTFDNDAWAYGYFGVDWCDLLEKVAINKTTKQATLANKSYYGIKPGQRFRFVNVLEEVDEPGEYYIHQRTGSVYFYPPVAWPARRATVTFLETPAVQIDQVNNFRLEGFTIQNGRNHGVQITDGDGVLVRGLTIRNFGLDGVRFRNGQNNGVDSSDITGMGENGIWMTGGDRKTLTNGGNFATNNWIRAFGQGVQTRNGVYLDGCGNILANNRIEDGAHSAVGLAGNNNIVEKNEISNVCTLSDDAGAIYIGRDITMRGNVIRNNYIQDVRSRVIDPNTGQPKGQIKGVYLDDMIAEQTVENNVFRRVDIAIFLGGGRNNVVRNNLAIDGKVGFWMDARGTTMDLISRWDYASIIAPFNITQPPFSTAYPSLANYFNDEPTLPKYNQFANNAFVNVTTPSWFRNDVDTMRDADGELLIAPSGNYAGNDPGLLNPGARDFRLVPGANAGGFQSIDSADWGLKTSSFRPAVTPLTGLSARLGP
jgi:hypothetical protein